MKGKIKKFLKDNSFWPITKWNSFEVIHRTTPPGNSKDLDKIRNMVSEKKGLYIYKKGRKTLYVGKGNPLFNRIKNHYISSYQEVAGDTKDKKWHKFFSSNTGRLKIYWKEEKNERIRQIIEKMLDYVLNPTFNSF